jgi:CubicO group peptidase (beta-lactamase class C family)
MKACALLIVVGDLTIAFACSSTPTLEEEMKTLVAELALPSDASLERALATVRNHFSLPGVAAAVVSPTEVLAESAVGYADSEEGVELGLHHRFDINSVTKSFTALLIAHLAEEGLLDYEQSVVELFPDLSGRVHADYAGLTIDELLRHTAGLSRNGEHIAARERPALRGSIMEDRARFTHWVLQHPAGAKRGEYSYSNAGYIILGAVIEKVTGRSWESEITERIFEPLSITSGSFGWLSDDATKYAIGHTRLSGGGIAQRRGHDDWYLYGTGFPMGGINLSIRDFATYAQYHLNGLAGRVERLSEPSFRGLHRVKGLYGRGWFASEFPGFSGSVHDGSDDGYYSKIFVSEESNLGVVVLTNVDDENAWRACNVVSYWLLKKYVDVPG